MTPEQLRTLADMEDRLDAVTHAEQDACDAAENDIAAMRTPITAERLRASGWKHKSTDDEIFQVDEFRMGGVTVRIGGGYVVVGVAGRRFDGVATFYDLRELVRMLGGAQ